MHDAAEEFLSGYSGEVATLASHYRELIKKLIPGIGEQIDVSARILGYGFGKRYVDSICTLIPSKKGLKLGFYKGSELPDPRGLLTGAGKVHKHIELKQDTDEEYVSCLLQKAYEAYADRMKVE